MTDYKELYLKLFRASEKAVKILIAAQQECEELFLNQPEPELKLVPLPSENRKSVDEGRGQRIGNPHDIPSKEAQNERMCG